MIRVDKADNLLQFTDAPDDYSVFGGVDAQEYCEQYEQYEQSEQCSYSPTEEEYSDYLVSLENYQVRD